jgi:hypothetical protein
MFDTQVDTLYVWVAVGAVSVAVFGIVTQLPTAQPPDGAAAATTIDEVATSPPGSVESRELDAEEWSLSRRQLGLRSDSATVRQTLLEPVVPATTDSLAAVLDGEDPEAVFDSTEAFRNATDRTGGTDWRPAPETMTVRHVRWGGVDVTLVG